MTEQQREDDLLAELLDLPDGQAHHAIGAALRAHVPALTRGDEQALLSAANAAGTPTLAPSPEPRAAAGSFGADLLGVVRRYPLPALAAGAGLALLLARRRGR